MACFPLLLRLCIGNHAPSEVGVVPATEFPSTHAVGALRSSVSTLGLEISPDHYCRGLCVIDIITV